MARASVNYQVKNPFSGCSYTAWENVDVDGTSELSVMEKLRKKESDALAKGDEISILKLEWQSS